MTIDNKYNIGETVYCKVDGEQLPWMVTAIVVRGTGHFQYECSGPGGHSFWVEEFEISNEEDTLLKLTQSEQ